VQDKDQEIWEFFLFLFSPLHYRELACSVNPATGGWGWMHLDSCIVTVTDYVLRSITCITGDAREYCIRAEIEAPSEY
jgi:hypothetical protein